MDVTYTLPPALATAVQACLDRWEADQLLDRLWERDPSVWTDRDEGQWLGWLDIVDEQRAGLPSMRRLAEEVASGDIDRILLLGMGGSSLAPDVLARTFGPRDGAPVLEILDSTDPTQVAAACDQLASTLVIVASKSGSTLEPNILKAYVYERMCQQVGASQAPRRFMAITDPGSPLEQDARATGFWRVVAGVPSIGGRFSALSNFGLVPAALAGIDVGGLLQRAADMVGRCGPRRPLQAHPAVVLGVILGEAARAGRDKPTFVLSPRIASLGAWLEQLVAESTGKTGRAIIPVDGELLGPPHLYGTDRVFVSIALASGGGETAAQDGERGRLLGTLEAAGHPVLRFTLRDPLDLGGELFRWEMATAVAGAVLEVNPFDQPDVEAAKVITRELATAYEATGRLGDEEPVWSGEGVQVFADARNLRALQAAGPAGSLAAWMAAHLTRVRAGDYVALLAYLPMSAACERPLQRLRHQLRDRLRVASTLGFGPRYLHSTGQAHKGGPDTGVFLLLTADHADDVPVPGRAYTFGTIEMAQALGDARSLAVRGRRLLRVHIGTDLQSGLDTLGRAIVAALSRA